MIRPVSSRCPADRVFRSALLADGAYAAKATDRFHPLTRAMADAVDPRSLAPIVSFFMVPSMGLAPHRAEAAIPDLEHVMQFLSTARAPTFPGRIDGALAAAGRDVYARACASCHGVYDRGLGPPRLLEFPNWAGDVGTDRSRVNVFDGQLAAAIAATPHGRRYLDAAATGKVAAPLLSGVWASAPYFVNGSVPTLRHLLEPETRPVRFMAGAYRLDLQRVGIAGTLQADGTWAYPPDYAPYATPVVIDTREPGFSNRGHESEVGALSPDERDALIEYLKLL